MYINVYILKYETHTVAIVHGRQYCYPLFGKENSFNNIILFSRNNNPVKCCFTVCAICQH